MTAACTTIAAAVLLGLPLTSVAVFEGVDLVFG
jgi:hypothetical protein